jgi:hypothetical protein
MRIDHASASARSASRIALVAASLALSAWIFAPRIRLLLEEALQRCAVIHIDHYHFAAVQAARFPDDLSDVGDPHVLDDAARFDLLDQIRA